MVKENEKKVLFDLSDERNFVAKQKEKCEKFLFWVALKFQQGLHSKTFFNTLNDPVCNKLACLSISVSSKPYQQVIYRGLY